MSTLESQVAFLFPMDKFGTYGKLDVGLEKGKERGEGKRWRAGKVERERWRGRGGEVERRRRGEGEGEGRENREGV